MFKTCAKYKVEILIAAVAVAVTLHGVNNIIEGHKVVVSFTDLPDPIVKLVTEGLIKTVVKEV